MAYNLRERQIQQTLFADDDINNDKKKIIEHMYLYIDLLHNILFYQYFLYPKITPLYFPK